MCLDGSCDRCRLRTLNASRVAEIDSQKFPRKIPSDQRNQIDKLLKPQYATTAYMLEHPDEFGGILVVLNILAEQTNSG